MHKSTINIEIALDADKMPEKIMWNAPDGGMDTLQEAKAMLFGVWDGNDKSALRIDLWTQKMMVDEMNDFFFQTFFGMADTFTRATNNAELSGEIKEFAKKFHKQVADTLNKEA